MTSIDIKQASEALSQIDDIVRRVRQSRIYDIASQIMIAAGVLVLAGNLATFVAPGYSPHIWISINVLNVAAAAVISMAGHRRTGVRALVLLATTRSSRAKGPGALAPLLRTPGWLRSRRHRLPRHPAARSPAAAADSRGERA